MAVNDSAETLERLVHLGHLSSGVGHNVINAFSAIVSNAELLRLNTPFPSIADPAVLAETIIKTALEAATVARRLIDYTRSITSIEPAPAAFQPQTLSIDRIVAEVVEAEKLLARPEIEWKTSLAPTPPIKGHEEQLKAMLRNLLQNVYDAIPSKGGIVRLSTSTDHRGWIVLEVRDSGEGMEPMTLERAVEPFFTTRPGRMGVGLSIANGIWRRHFGTLSIQSMPGEGTRIRLCVEPGAA